MDDKPTGPCCVCGVPTNQRCSECGRLGFNLFICGTEHQKVIWFVHKRVCGDKLKPFCFPRLSKWEFEKATEYLHASTGPYINVGGTIATNLAYAFSRPIGDAPALLALLHSQRPVPLESFTLQVILATVRSTIYHHLRSGIQPLDNGDRPKLPYEARTLELYDPLHVLAHHTLNLDKGLVQGGINLENGQPEWYSQLMHFALFLCALCHHQRRLFLSDPAFSSSPARQTTYKFILAALTRLCEI